jgi:hypothetical protein
MIEHHDLFHYPLISHRRKRGQTAADFREKVEAILNAYKPKGNDPSSKAVVLRKPSRT